MNSNTTVRELINSGKYGEFADYFWTYVTDDHLDAPLNAYGYEACDFEFALGRIEELVKSGKSYVYPVYTRQEIYVDHALSEAKLIFFPAMQKVRDDDLNGSPFALVIPGGGFARQWTLIEGFAIASRLNEMGIPAFVLMYRTAKRGVLSMAIEDMHRAVRYITDNAKQFDVSSSSYILGGFSAGATLAASMATDNLGWKAASLPKPEMIFLGYLAQKMDLFYNTWESTRQPTEKEQLHAFLSRIVPEEITKSALDKFIIENHISKETCPPLFFTANHDDPVVSFEHSYSLYQKATDLGIRTACRFGETGGHSYGIGNGLEVSGWLNDAVIFWRTSADDALGTVAK